MNERIEKLAEQSKQYAREQMAHPMDPMIFSSAVFNQKFAELIVNECANLSFRSTGFVTSEGEEMVRNMIKKHFGVE